MYYQPKKYLIGMFVSLLLLLGALAFGQSSGPIVTPSINKAYYYVGTSPYLTTIQSAVTAACANTAHAGQVIVPPGVTPTDNPAAQTGCANVAIRVQSNPAGDACYSYATSSSYVVSACTVGSASTATNLAGGVIGDVPYQTAAGATSFIAPGTLGQTLTSNGPGAAPSYQPVAGLQLNPASGVNQTVTQQNSSLTTSNQFSGATPTPTTTLQLQTNASGAGYYINNGPWASHNGINNQFYSNTLGIDHAISMQCDMMHIGDQACWYAYNLMYGGAEYGSDEGADGNKTKDQQIGYSKATIATPITGGLYQDTNVFGAGTTYISVINDNGYSPFLPVNAGIQTIQMNFPVAVVSTYTLNVYLFSAGAAVGVLPVPFTLVTTIPLTIPAGTSGLKTFTSGTDFSPVSGVFGQYAGMYWPSGTNGPGGINSSGSYHLAGAASGTATYTLGGIGTPRIEITQTPAPTGATNLFASGFTCNSHAEGCMGQYSYGWATGAPVLDMQNPTPPQLTLASNTTVLGDSMTFNVSSGTVTPSTAWGQVASGTPNGNYLNSQVAQSDTLTVTLGTSPASPGAFVAGADVCLAGWYREEAAVTAVGTPSGGTQTVTILTYHNWGAGTTIMQGGPCGQFMVYNSNLVAGNSYWPMSYQLLGATSSTQILAAACVTGGCTNLAVSPWSTMLPSGPQNAQATYLTRTSNVVTAKPAPFVLNIDPYLLGSTVYVTGCTNADLNGSFTVTVNSMDNLNPVLQWAQTGANEGPDTTCSINTGTPTVSLFPGAFLNGSPNTSSLQFQANQVPWVTGDSIVQSPATAFAETDLAIVHGQSTPGYNAQAEIYVNDEGPTSVQDAIQLTNTNPGGDALSADGRYQNDIYLKYRPANNGAVIYNSGIEPITSSLKPYYFYEDGNQKIGIDPINNYVFLPSNFLVAQEAKVGSLGIGLPANPGDAVAPTITFNASTTARAASSCSTLSNTNTNWFAAGTSLGLEQCDGTTWQSIFVTNQSTKNTDFPHGVTIAGAPPATLGTNNTWTGTNTFTNTTTLGPVTNATSINATQVNTGGVQASAGTFIPTIATFPALTTGNPVPPGLVWANSTQLVTGVVTTISAYWRSGANPYASTPTYFVLLSGTAPNLTIVQSAYFATPVGSIGNVTYTLPTPWNVTAGEYLGQFVPSTSNIGVANNYLSPAVNNMILNVAGTTPPTGVQTYSYDNSSPIAIAANYSGTVLTTGLILTQDTLTGATPVINLGDSGFSITLSANTTPTTLGAPLQGNTFGALICQPATGGPYTFTWPAVFHGGAAVPVAASTCIEQDFRNFGGANYYGTNVSGMTP